MLEESEDTYLLLFRGLQERGLRTPWNGQEKRTPKLLYQAT